MAQDSAWSRRFGSALVAVLLMLFALSPGVDALVCAADGLAPAEASAAAKVAPAKLVRVGQSQAIDSHSAEAPGTCPHGHCHATPYPPASSPIFPGIEVKSERFDPLPSERLASLPTSGPERPPRA